jgi:diguanylate cyclase (GGDEF)-like protein
MTEAVLGVWWVENADSPVMKPADVLPADGFLLHVEDGATLSGQPLVGGTHADAIVLSMADRAAVNVLDWLPLPSLAAETAIVVLAPAMTFEDAVQLLQAGVQDVVSHADASSLAQRVHLAVMRKHLERETRKAHATDLGTGLPNRPQLVELMSQLLALREREPKPVSVLVLRIDRLAGVEAGHGVEAANVVRRKIAVRLRAGVRASDVVASLGADVFGVLLPSTESPDDAQRVVDKLARSLRQPFKVAGTDVGVTAHVGIAHFPEDGRQPDELLRHASAAALATAYGAQGAANE